MTFSTSIGSEVLSAFYLASGSRALTHKKIGTRWEGLELSETFVGYRRQPQSFKGMTSHAVFLQGTSSGSICLTHGSTGLHITTVYVKRFTISANRSRSLKLRHVLCMGRFEANLLVGPGLLANQVPSPWLRTKTENATLGQKTWPVQVMQRSISRMPILQHLQLLFMSMGSSEMYTLNFAKQ